MDGNFSREFLFTTFDGGGNVAPVMGVVHKLVARGHRVRVMSDTVNKEDVLAVGADFVPWMSAPNKVHRSRETEFADWALPTLEEALKVMTAGFMCGQALAYAVDLMAAIERDPADLVVNSDLILGVILGCEARRQALVLLSTCIASPPFEMPGQPPFGLGLSPATTTQEVDRYKRLTRERTELYDTGLTALNAAREQLGLLPLGHVSEQLRPARGRFLGTARIFDFPCEVPQNTVYVGPLLHDPVWAGNWVPEQDERPLVVVAFSTTFQNHVDCLQRVIDACSTMPVRVLVTLGRVLQKHEIRPAANSSIVDSAPHGVVMRDAAVVVTHGGHGTVMTALIHGIPMLILPHGRDQADNAARVTHHGAGLALPNTAPIREIRSAITRLFTETSFVNGAKRLGDAVAEEVANSTLIGELEDLAYVSRSNTRRGIK